MRRNPGHRKKIPPSKAGRLKLSQCVKCKIFYIKKYGHTCRKDQ